MFADWARRSRCSVDVRVVACSQPRPAPTEVAGGPTSAKTCYYPPQRVPPDASMPLRERHRAISLRSPFAMVLRHTRWPETHCPGLRRKARWTSSPRIRGRAMFASWRTSSAARCCWSATRRRSVRGTCGSTGSASAPPVSSSLFEPRRLADVSRRSEEEEIVRRARRVRWPSPRYRRTAGHFRTHAALPASPGCATAAGSRPEPSGERPGGRGRRGRLRGRRHHRAAARGAGEVGTRCAASRRPPRRPNPGRQASPIRWATRSRRSTSGRPRLATSPRSSSAAR